jgi:chromosomal replication initiation ATPase DnaA
MEQLTLNVKPCNSNYNNDDYIISECNKLAYRHIIDSDILWGIMPYNKFLLILGPKFSGKTYLSKIWARKTGAIILDHKSISSTYYRGLDMPLILEDIEEIKNEEELFHLFNYRINSNYQTLFTAGFLKNFNLKDLNSRIRSINKIAIEEPDERLVKIIIKKLFSDRSIKITNEVLNYLLYRLPRSYESINNLVNKTDQESLEQKREITIPLISKIL